MNESGFETNSKSGLRVAISARVSLSHVCVLCSWQKGLALGLAYHGGIGQILCGRIVPWIDGGASRPLLSSNSCFNVHGIPLQAYAQQHLQFSSVWSYESLHGPRMSRTPPNRVYSDNIPWRLQTRLCCGAMRGRGAASPPPAGSTTLRGSSRRVRLTWQVLGGFSVCGSM